MTIDKRFALITSTSEVLYPYKKHQIATKRDGFVLTCKGNYDRGGGGVYTDDIEEVVRNVVLGDWGVRARTENRFKEGTYTLGKRAIVNYWLAPELRHLVSAAKLSPLPHLPGASGMQTSSSTDAIAAIERLTSKDYEEALQAIDHSISGFQHSMLLGHALAPNHTLTMKKLAEAGPRGGFEAANLHYGELGRLFADHFSVVGIANQIEVIARAHSSRNQNGHSIWTLRPGLLEAMGNLGLIEPQPEPGAITAAAEAEIDADPLNAGLTSTERRALVNARNGQGGYRKRMLRLWKGRCAVTGCAIDCVLIASHAKSWSESDNSERLDEYNGLLLAASVDRLFDKGLIAFSDDGKLLAAPSLDLAALVSIGLTREARLSGVHARHRPYLRAHRIKNKFEVESLI